MYKERGNCGKILRAEALRMTVVRRDDNCEIYDDWEDDAV